MSKFIKNTKMSFASFIIYNLLILSNKSNSLTVINKNKNMKLHNMEAGLYCVWHRFIWIASYLLRRKKYYTLASLSKDGQLITLVLNRLGFNVVRGSSSRGGTASLRKIYSLLKKKEKIILTPDGPTGPVYKVKPGIVYLQEKTAVPIYPLGVAVKRKLTLNSWDRFVIPYPFTEVVVVVGKPLFLSGQISVARRCDLLEQEMSFLEKEAAEILESINNK